MLSVSFIIALLGAMLTIVNAQSTFDLMDTSPSSVWSPRAFANVEYVPKTTSFFFNGRSSQLTNYFLLYGGETDYSMRQNLGSNDVWASTDGMVWRWVSGIADGEEHARYPLASFAPHRQNGHCQDSKYNQYRVGGQTANGITNEVWYSSNGYSWTQQVTGEVFAPSYLSSMTSDSKGAIYIAGGILAGRRVSNEVWSSTNQGRDWTLVNADQIDGNPDAVPGARGVALMLNSHSAATGWTADVLLWLTGVDTTINTDTAPAYYKDIWVSSDSGKSFAAITRDVKYGRRNDAGAEITSAGLIVLAGGHTRYDSNNGEEILNDVWVSANGGYTWGRCVEDAEWNDRRYQMTVIDGKGYLWVMGGAGTTRFNDIWKSVWSYSDVKTTAARCGISEPSCGVGLRCWPNQPGTLTATDGSGVYCGACPYSGFGSSTSTAVVAFLVVFLLLFVITGSALVYTYYKLRAAGAPSPIPLPTSVQSWWNKSSAHSAPLITTADSSSNGDGLYQPLRIRDQV